MTLPLFANVILGIAYIEDNGRMSQQFGLLFGLKSLRKTLYVGLIFANVFLINSKEIYERN